MTKQWYDCGWCLSAPCICGIFEEITDKKGHPMTDTSKEAVVDGPEKFQFVPYGGAGKLPVEQCEFSVVDESKGEEICRCWTLEAAQSIAFRMNLDNVTYRALRADRRNVALSAERDALQAKLDEAVGALEAARDWIDAVPKDTALPAMPGFDRDDFDNTLAKIKAENAKMRELGSIGDVFCRECCARATHSIGGLAYCDTCSPL